MFRRNIPQHPDTLIADSGMLTQLAEAAAEIQNYHVFTQESMQPNTYHSCAKYWLGATAIGIELNGSRDIPHVFLGIREVISGERPSDTRLIKYSQYGLSSLSPLWRNYVTDQVFECYYDSSERRLLDTTDAIRRDTNNLDGGNREIQVRELENMLRVKDITIGRWAELMRYVRAFDPTKAQAMPAEKKS